MKILQRLFLLLVFGSFLCRAVAAEEVVVERIPLTPDQLEALVAPIALYPDPLVALILPASTFPSDVVLAARFLERGGLPDNAGVEPWDDSVQSLARYREVIDYLDDNLDWTRRLGYSFLDQPDAVMDAIQTVRIRARTAGLLADTAEQQVIVETEEIRIIPAQPTFIYVPRYDPVILCRPSFSYSSYRGPFITFGIGWRVGTWLNFDCDWRSRGIRIVHRPANWYYRPDWSNRDRYRDNNFTNWTRRNHSRHDDRFDRSPRFAGYNARGADHRGASTPNRFDGRTRDGNWDDDRRSRDQDRRGDRNYSAPTHAQMAREIQGRQRREMEVLQDRLLAPATASTSAGPSSPQERRRPESANRPDHSRRDRDQSSDRSRPERVAAREVSQRSQPRVEQPRAETPPPARQVEASNRSEDRSRNDSGDRANPHRGGGRSDRDSFER